MKFIKNKLNLFKYHLAAFFIPALVIFIIYLTQGIYWGSDRSPLLGDGYHQYVIFDVALSNALHNQQHLLYNFTSGLGINFYALSSYYLGSFLSPLVYFFDNQSMPDAVYFFTIVKFGLIGLSSYISLAGIFKKIPQPLLLVLSTSFSLMSFSTSQLEIKNWLDVFILFPLIIYGLHRLIHEKKRGLYYLSLTCLLVQNYYFAFMICLFLPLWYLLQISYHFKERVKSFPDFLITSLLAGLTSLFMLLPTYLDLRTHGETFTKVDKLVNPDSWYLDFFAKNLVGSFDTTKYGSIPMIYIGLLSLILAFSFFLLKKVKFHVKLFYLLLLTFFLVSFSLQPLDLFWQGMHAPNMFLHRYSWLLSFVILYLAAETLNRLEELGFKQILLSSSLILLGFVACFYYRKHYDFLTDFNFLISLEFLLSYLLFFWILLNRKFSYKVTQVFFLLFLIFELGINTFYQIEGIADEWVFSSRSSYATNMKDINQLVAFSKTNQEHFYRTEKLTSQTGNDSMKYGYYGISQFSSVRNTQSSSTLDQLGFLSAGTNLNLRYQNNTILMDSLFGVEYNLSTYPPQKFGFQKVSDAGKVKLYKNHYANQLAFLTNGLYKDASFNHLTLDNQKRFLNQLSGLDLNYFTRVSILDEANTEHKNDLVTVKPNPAIALNDASASYTIQVKKNQQVYITLPDLVFSNSDKETVNLTVNNQTRSFTTNNVFPLFNIGPFDKDETVEVMISFPENKSVTFKEAQFYALDLDNYQKVFDKLKEQKTRVLENQSGLLVDYKADKESSLFITLPYDKGWSATLNGRPLKIQQAQKGFMKIDLKKGQGKIQLTFLPQGLKEGTIISILALLTFLTYDFFRKRAGLNNNKKG